MAGLMCGITAAYIPEEGISLDLLSKDCRHLIRKFSQEKNHGKIIIRNEWASSTYTTDVISSIYESEGNNLFDCRASVLGHIQQGGTPSPMDRVLGCRLAVASLGWIEQQFEKMYPDSGFKADFLDTIERCPSGDESAVVIGFSGTATKITSVKDLIPEVDFVERKWKKCWWLELNRLIRVLSDTVNE
jgi:6-phosphofructokinase 1